VLGRDLLVLRARLVGIRGLKRGLLVPGALAEVVGGGGMASGSVGGLESRLFFSFARTSDRLYNLRWCRCCRRLRRRRPLPCYSPRRTHGPTLASRDITSGGCSWTNLSKVIGVPKICP
jgi:hypothetical protein